jgi:hypothetical protein
LGPGRPVRENTCRQDDAWGAIFLFPHEHRLLYKICIRRPDRSHDCYRRQTFKYGHRSADGFYGTAGSDQLGIYRFTWKVPGRGVIDRDPIRIRAPRPD